MPRSTLRRALLSASVLVSWFGTQLAAQSANPPNFSPSGDISWINDKNRFIPPLSGPGPVGFHPAYPPGRGGGPPDAYIPNPDNKYSGPVAQPMFPVADLNSPILQPWAREELRKRNERILGGGTGYNRQVACWPVGVPAFLLYAVQPVFFIQTPGKVVMIWQNDHQLRHVYLNLPHSADPKPSWYGESVGHYEGDTLVVDTIGLSRKTFVDNYHTPHTDRLHVIERFRMIEGGSTLEVNVYVEDEGAFTTPWSAIQRYRRVESGKIMEVACAENNINPFQQDIEPMPQAEKPDF